jgi:hypothetical protein
VELSTRLFSLDFGMDPLRYYLNCYVETQTEETRAIFVPFDKQILGL